MKVNSLRLDIFASNQSGWTEDCLMKLHTALLAVIEDKCSEGERGKLVSKYFLDSESTSKAFVKKN